MPLQQGGGVWVCVPDPNGVNLKERPAVVVTPTEAIVPGEAIVLVAVTSTFTRPLPANRVELPWHNAGHPVTGLKRRCVAVCDWLIVVDQAAVIGVAGTVPIRVLNSILAQLPPPSSGDAVVASVTANYANSSRIGSPPSVIGTGRSPA